MKANNKTIDAEQIKENLQKDTIKRDLYVNRVICCESSKELKEERQAFNNEGYQEQKVNDKVAEHKKANAINANEVILAVVIYFAFSCAFTQTLTAWTAAVLGVSIALATLLITAAFMSLWFGWSGSYLLQKYQSIRKQFNEKESKKKIEYTLYALAYIIFLAIPFLPFGSLFFSTILINANILFEIGMVPTAIVLMIVWSLIPITIINGITTKHTNKKENKDKIDAEILHKNPIHRIRHAYFKLFHSLYLHGMQNPISMLIFSTLFFGTIIDMCNPFLPTAMHNVLVTLAYGVTNAALGPFVIGFMLGWFLGLFALVVCDIISREESNTSGTILNCVWLRDHLLDAILFTILLIMSAHLMSGSAVAYICGNWEILGLLTINLKPVLGVYDFVTDPVRSVIGTCTILVPLMPFTIIMYPELCIEYIIDFIITSITNTVRYLLCVLLVLVTAVMDLIILANQKIHSYVPKFPDKTTILKTQKENLFYNFEMLRLNITESYTQNKTLKTLSEHLGKVLNTLYVVFLASITLSATSVAISSSILPPAILSFGMWPVTMLAAYISTPTAALIIAMTSAYLLSLSLCNFTVSLNDRKNYVYLKDNLFIALIFFVTLPLLAVHTQVMVIASYSTIMAHCFSMLMIACSFASPYYLSIRDYSTKQESMVFIVYENIYKTSSDIAKHIDDKTKPAQNMLKRFYDDYSKATNSWMSHMTPAKQKQN